MRCVAQCFVRASCRLNQLASKTLNTQEDTGLEPPQDRVFPRDNWTADGLKDFLQGMADKGIKVMFVNKGENV